jgi:hypothetical protein
MMLRAPTNTGRGRGHFPRSCGNLEPGEETSARGYEGHEAAQVGLLASPERPEACATVLIGVRTKT